MSVTGDINETVIKTEPDSSPNDSENVLQSVIEVKNEPLSPPPPSSRQLIQAPPPPTGLDWAAAYEAKKRAVASASSANSQNQIKALVRVEITEEPFIKVEPQEFNKDLSGPPESSTESKTLRKVTGVILKDEIPEKPVVASLSNRQSKKLEQQEGRKTSVERLIKRVTVDKEKGSDDWAAEYAARKEAALERMESGVSATNVGSLSAFHSGVYGGVIESDCGKAGPLPMTMNKPEGMEIDSSRLSKPIFPNELSGSQAKTASKSVPPSPKTVVNTNKSFSSLKPASNQASKSQSIPPSNPVISQCPEVVPPSSSNQMPKKAPTMAQMFRDVKADAKRSQTDWQAEYEARKRARMEAQKKEQDKIKLSKVDFHSTKVNHPTIQTPSASDKPNNAFQGPRPSTPSDHMSNNPSNKFQPQFRPSSTHHQRPISTSSPVPINNTFKPNNFNPVQRGGYQGPQGQRPPNRGYPRGAHHNRGCMRPSYSNVRVPTPPRGNWQPRGQGNFRGGSSQNSYQFRGQGGHHFGRGFQRGHRPPF